MSVILFSVTYSQETKEILYVGNVKATIAVKLLAEYIRRESLQAAFNKGKLKQAEEEAAEGNDKEGKK